MLTRLAMLFVLLGACTALMIVKDLLRNPQPVRIRNIVWPVTGLYMPFFGWLAYWYFGRNARPQGLTLPSSSPPSVKHIFNATGQCAAGCVLGDIIAIPLTFIPQLRIPGSLLLTHAAISLVLSLFFGLIFQFLALRQIQPVSFVRTLLLAFKSDIYALLSFQMGLFLYMELAFRFVLHHQITPGLLTFWFMLQIAMCIGFIFAWPANKFLLRRGIKPAL